MVGTLSVLSASLLPSRMIAGMKSLLGIPSLPDRFGSCPFSGPARALFPLFSRPGSPVVQISEQSLPVIDKEPCRIDKRTFVGYTKNPVGQRS